MEEIVDERFTDVLNEIRLSEWVKKEDIHVSILRQERTLVWKMFPVVDLALIFADPSLPHNYRCDIILWLTKLDLQIDKTTEYLSTDAKAEAELLHHKTIIQEGLKTSLAAATTKHIGERNKFEDDLKPLFCSSNLTSALRAVINELTTKSLLLESVYEKTNGHWPKVKIILDRILSLIVGALFAIVVYDTSSGIKAVERLHPLKKEMEAIEKKIQSVFERCRSEFRQNMSKDLDEALDRSVSNDLAVYRLSALMSEKYDWLVNHCIICYESISMNYCFLGNHVKRLGRNGKFGVIFYREALMDETVNCEKYRRVNSVLADLAKNSSAYSTAEELCQQVLNTYQTIGVEVFACAVIRPMAALQWIPFYGTGAMMAYGTSIRTLQQKGSCGTVCENWLSDTFRLNPLLDIALVPLAITEAFLVYYREGGVKARFFVVMYNP